MNEVFERKLESGETLLWTGKAASSTLLDKTNKNTMLVKSLVSVAAAIVLLALAINANHDLQMSVIVMIIILGLIVPVTSFSDATKARKLLYGATDKRLIKINGQQALAVDYTLIDDAAIREDEDGNMTLLCGEKAVTAKSSKWRSMATLGNALDTSTGRCDKFVFYAVDDIEGLKSALKGRLNVR